MTLVGFLDKGLAGRKDVVLPPNQAEKVTFGEELDPTGVVFLTEVVGRATMTLRLFRMWVLGLILGGCGGAKDDVEPLDSNTNEGPSGPGPVDHSPSGGSSNGGPRCIAGGSCPCDNLMSVMICVDDVAVCDCDSCPDFIPSPPPSFVACGGEPFGRWRSVASESDGYQLHFADSDDTCPSHGAEEIGQEDVRFEFISGGEAVFYRSGVQLTFRTGVECGACDSFTGVRADLTCTDAGCGACDCDLDVWPLKLEGAWSREDTTLYFHSSEFADTVYEYCVEADQMRLRDETGRTLTLVKVGAEGTPTPCGERSVDECTMGNGCRLGACVGAASCAEAGSETDCGVLAGCTWDTSICAGTLDEECELEDYDVVPGCMFTERTVCTGSRTPCHAIVDDATCRQSPGCEVEGGCAGGPESCSQHGWSLSGCEGLPGCTWTTSNTCSGTFQCEDLTNLGRCELLGEQGAACYETSCAGEAAPCSELTVFDCESAPGCELVAPP